MADAAAPVLETPGAAPIVEAAAPVVAAVPEAAAPAAPSLTPTLLEKFDTEAAKKAEPAAPKEPVKPAVEAKPAEVVKPADDKAAKPAEAKPAEAKPAEAKPAEAAKPAESAKPETEKPAVEAPKPEPVEYKYALPEGMTMDDALKGKVHSAFDEFRSNPAEGAQKLIDLYAEQKKADAEQALKTQFDVFNKTKGTWEKDWLADPQIGGAGHRTALGAIARIRDLGVSSAKEGTPQYEADWQQFDQFLAITGAGSHPAFGRLMHNLARFIDEPQSKDLPTDIKPTKTNGKAPKGSLYTHPSSANMEAK